MQDLNVQLKYLKIYIICQLSNRKSFFDMNKKSMKK